MTEKDKILISKSILNVSIILIIISVILKLLGLNVFDSNIDSQILNYIIKFLEIDVVNNILAFIFLFTDYFIIFRLSCNNQNIKIYYIAALMIAFISIISQILVFSKMDGSLYTLFSILLIFITTIIINKKLNIKKPLIVMGLIILYQMVALFLKNITFNDNYNVLCNFLLNFDYIILMIITYYLYFKEGGDFKCSVVSSGAHLFLQRKIFYQELRKSYQEFLSSTRRKKAETIIFLILSTLWEVFTIGLVIFIAILNHTLIECLFIITAFITTKKVFGTPFHFDSALKCFVVSNLTYYALNRITVSINISFIIPITLGILLGYVTSKFVKENNEKLYRGMAKEDLLEMCKGLDKFEKELLVDYYCNRMTYTALSFKYNYSERSIFDKRKKALEKLKIN